MEAKMIARVEAEFVLERERFRKREHPVSFPALPDLPAGRYTDGSFFTQEQSAVWSKSWLFAGHVDELAEVGSYRLWRDAGVPVIIIRGRDGIIRGFYNTCRHRGGPLVREACGSVSSLLCKYHSWNYDLTGKLTFVPDEHEFPGLDKSERGLIAVRVELWGNWIFVCLDDEAPALADFFGCVIEEMADFTPESLKLVEKHSFDIACNWKVAMDAFQEVYHIKHVHPNTVDAQLDHSGASMALYGNGHSRMIVPHKEGSPRRASVDSHGNQRVARPGHDVTRNASRSYNLFPNIVTPTAEFEFPFLVFWPTSIRTCRMDVWWWGQADDCDPTTDLWKQRLAGFDVVLNEDMENLGWIQESLETPGFKGVPLGYQERRIYNHHEQVDRVIGEDNIPRGLAIEKLMAPFIEG